MYKGITSQRGQINVAAASVSAIVGILAIIIFSTIYSALNTEIVSPTAVTLLNLIDLLLAAILIIGIVSLLIFRLR